MSTLNLGILARGITIRSAVVSFAIDDLTVNLIDTPGHPDFIAEVERVLGVLDGAVLVVSAVEGVQPQTRAMMRTLRRLHIPTLVFVDKVDRLGAQHEGVLHSVAEKLTPAIIAMGSTSGLGTRGVTWAPYTAADKNFVSRLVDVLADGNDASPHWRRWSSLTVPPTGVRCTLRSSSSPSRTR